MKRSEKSLGQIAYESVEIGGKQNWGSWVTAPQTVRDAHEHLARVVVKEFQRRAKKTLK